eukprot:4079998-Alexandrium_andersonii.AAC.1
MFASPEPALCAFAAPSPGIACTRVMSFLQVSTTPPAPFTSWASPPLSSMPSPSSSTFRAS